VIGWERGRPARNERERERMILTRARTLAKVNNLPLRWLLFGE